jgi:hypothetical protein
MFYNFFSLNNDKIATNLTTPEAREKYKNTFGILAFFDVCVTKFKNKQILLN